MPKHRFEAVANSVAGKYNLSGVKFIDKGAFKETYRAEDSNTVYYAIKILDPAKCSSARTSREIDAILKCNSPHIAKLLDFGTLDFHGDNYLFTIEEFFLGGTLNDKCRKTPISPKIARSYAKTLSEAISHLKDIDLVHRDIKPANIMFRDSSNSPILVDFGLVRDLTKTSATCSWLPRGPCTPFFAAPEQLNNEKALIGWRTDQFGLGITLAYCLTGRHPYQKTKMTPNAAVDAVGKRQIYSDAFKNYAEQNGLDFILKMIEPWPVRRYGSISDLIKSI
jgi:serine/threonine protein kinase